MPVTTFSILIATLVFFASVWVLVYWKKLRSHRKSDQFPGPPGYPIIGNAHLFFGCTTEDIFYRLQKLLDTYTSPFRISFGGKTLNVVYDPEQLKAILTSPKAIEKSGLYRFLQPWIGLGLVTSPASMWRDHRKLIQPTFNLKILESFFEIFAAKSEILVKELEAEVNEKECALFDYFSRCTLDMVCETVMGVPSNFQTVRTSAYVDATQRLFHITSLRMFKVWLQPDIIFNNTSLGQEYWNCIKTVHKVTDDVIQKKKRDHQLRMNQQEFEFNENEAKGRKKAFLDLLVELSYKGTGLTDQELREHAVTMIAAGNDTSATTTSFVTLMLATYPEVQQKVYDELCEIFDHEDPTSAPIRYEHLRKMQYLESVIKETMRIFPAAAHFLRDLTDDLDVGGFTLPKGSSVILSIVKTHRSEKYWKDPMKFKPERFLSDECDKHHPYAFIPFGAGPRNCIGTTYAMIVMKVMLAALVRKYIIKSDRVQPIEDIKLKFDFVLKPLEPIKLKIEKRVN